MKRRLIAILAVVCLSASSWAQEGKVSFDLRKAQAEMEIMKGIFRTTIKYVAQDYKDFSSRWSYTDMITYYLAGQGAMFIIPTSGFRPVQTSSSPFIFIPNGQSLEQLEAVLSTKYTKEATLKLLEKQTAELEAQMKRLSQNLNSREESPSDQAAKNPPLPPPSSSQVNREELRKRIEDVQKNLKKSQKAAEDSRENFAKILAEMKVCLIEAVANYGDTMMTVKPDEYINVIFWTENLGSDAGFSTHYDIVSAKKSWISEYKSGELSMDGFKQKILQYT
jgi:DNA-binding transcriptional MerR regulator